MSAGYTPAPWSVSGCRLNLKDAGSAHHITGKDEASVAAAFYDGRTTESHIETWSNALLIAAAPELYEALELVVKRCGPNSADGKIAHLALRKARGETQ